MEGVVTHAPSHRALFARRRSLVGLTLDAVIHDVVATDGAVVDHDVPRPESDGVPFLHLESLLVGLGGAGRGGVLIHGVYFHRGHSLSAGESCEAKIGIISSAS